MELFLLALLAAAAAADTAQSSGSTPQLPPPPPDPEPDENEVKAMLFWNTIAYNPKRPMDSVVYWTPRQEAAWMLDRLVCPEGHGDPKHLSYIDQIESHLTSLHQGLDDWSEAETRASTKGPPEGAEPWASLYHREWHDSAYIASTIWCHHPNHKGPRGTILPHHVAKVLERTW
jgi:hypothetical protein